MFMKKKLLMKILNKITVRVTKPHSTDSREVCWSEFLRVFFLCFGSIICFICEEKQTLRYLFVCLLSSSWISSSSCLLLLALVHLFFVCNKQTSHWKCTLVLCDGYWICLRRFSYIAPCRRGRRCTVFLFNAFFVFIDFSLDILVWCTFTHWDQKIQILMVLSACSWCSRCICCIKNVLAMQPKMLQCSLRSCCSYSDGSER